MDWPTGGGGALESGTPYGWGGIADARTCSHPPPELFWLGCSDWVGADGRAGGGATETAFALAVALCM
eukprot:86246-Prorocentrum_minimum.AAC.1